MSTYPPPTNWTQSIFNPANWVSYNDALTLAMGNKKYLIKTGSDTDIGPLTLKNPLKIQDGSLLSPSIQFVNSSNMGLYKSSATECRMSVQGIDSVGFVSYGLKLYASISGYIPSTLNCYEEGVSFNITWSHGNATSVVVSAFCTRIGRIVVFYTNDIIFNSFATNNPITIQSSASIPARFRPTLSPIGFFGAWGNDQAGTYDNWFAFIQSDGSITMYPRGYGASNAKFWIYGFCGTWVI